MNDRVIMSLLLRFLFFTLLLVAWPLAALPSPFLQTEPAAEPASSDERALELADQAMAAMGGAENYDQTRYLAWDFFGRRFHVWDKHTGNIRIEYKDGPVVLMNIHNKEGKVWQNGELVEEPKALAEALENGYAAWINDSYWLVMPYKLRDPGVTLRYSREENTQDGRAADVLTMTFQKVGLTPENKYEVFIDKESRLVTQWAFYRQATDAEPGFVVPWANWRDFGKIKLSDDRGQRKLERVAVFQELPDSVFQNPDPVKFD